MHLSVVFTRFSAAFLAFSRIKEDTSLLLELIFFIFCLKYLHNTIIFRNFALANGVARVKSPVTLKSIQLWIHIISESRYTNCRGR